MNQLFKKYIALFKKGDLRVRYTIAIIIIAILAIIQFLITFESLDIQQDSFRIILKSRENIESLRRQRKSLLRIQTLTDATEIQKQLQNINSELMETITSESIIWDTQQNNSFSETFSIENSKINSELGDLQRKIVNTITSQSSIPNDEVVDYIFTISKLLEKYINLGTEEISFFEGAISNKFNSLKQTDLYILIFLLLVLIFEAIYIISPAISKLDRALKARSDFFSRMGHEIRNPMNSILGMADLLEKNERDQTQLIYVKRLKKSAEGLLTFLNNIIEFASIEHKKQKADLSSFSLQSLIDDIFSLFFLEANKKSILFFASINSKVPQNIQSDFLKLKHIIVNLVGNAIKFTNKGHVTIDLDFNHNEKKLIVKVIDTGVGISEDKQLNIFEEFVQEDSSVKRKYGGTGLGLAIAKEYSEVLEGQIYLESKINQGSIFTVEIPIADFEGEIPNHLSQFDTLYCSDNPALMLWFKKHLRESTQVHFLSPEQIQSLDQQIDSHEKTAVFVEDISLVKALTKKADQDLQFFQLSPQSEYSGNPYVLSLFPISPWLPSPSLSSQSKSFNSALICDDSEDNRLVLESQLASHFSHIVTVDNGYDCLAKLKENNFSAVFLDIQMPEMDGFTVMSEAEKFVDKKETIFIAFTAHNTFIEKFKMREAGFEAILEKPIRTKNLHEILYSLNITEEESEPQNSPETPEEIDFEARVRQRLLAKKSTFIKQKLEQIDQFPQNEQSQSQLDFLQNLGHQLKGSSSYYGFEQLADWGAQLEVLAKSKKLNQSRDQLAVIRRFLNNKSSYN